MLIHYIRIEGFSIPQARYLSWTSFRLVRVEVNERLLDEASVSLQRLQFVFFINQPLSTWTRPPVCSYISFEKADKIDSSRFPAWRYLSLSKQTNRFLEVTATESNCFEKKNRHCNVISDHGILRNDKTWESVMKSVTPTRSIFSCHLLGTGLAVSFKFPEHRLAVNHVADRLTILNCLNYSHLLLSRKGANACGRLRAKLNIRVRDTRQLG